MATQNVGQLQPIRGSSQDCVAILKRHETITGANHMFRLRRRFETTVVNDLNPGDPGYTSALQLMNTTKMYEKILNAHQRVIDRFGGAKKPDALSIQVNQAKSLRTISTILTGILDILRYSANLPALDPPAADPESDDDDENEEDNRERNEDGDEDGSASPRGSQLVTPPPTGENPDATSSSSSDSNV